MSMCTRAAAPIMWLDALDVPLHHYMGTGAFQPGPVADLPETVADAAFAVANVVPDTSYATTDYSPVFRYPYATAAAAVAAAPPARDGSRRVRYVNPLNAGSGDGADRLLPGAARSRHDHAAVPHQRQLGLLRGGRRRRKPGRQRDRFAWKKRDIFTLPQGNRIVHSSTGGTARLFQVSDRDIYARLGLLKEEYGNIAA